MSALTAKLGTSITALQREDWNRLAACGSSALPNPFISYEFLSALEDSASIGPGTGWQAAPIVLEDDAGVLLGALPAYLKGHSQGEYVFDHGWADAYERAGGRYYPKLQIAAPFTPASGPRILTNDPAHAAALLRAAEQVAEANAISSVHATFIAEEQRALFEAAGWLMRSDIQFHWFNRGYANFDEFLAALSSRKRRFIRKERAAAQHNLTIKRLSGADITEQHWDIFWRFYQDTGARKWGTPYLTREAFSLMGERMGSQILLFLAYEGETAIAGALNFIGVDTLYGRYWGCLEERPFLHFELCYYQAMDEAIARGIPRVEAGAQGPHKLLRGYEPVETWSAHYIVDEGFRTAIAQFLEREKRGITADKNYLETRLPFKRGD